MKKIRLMPLYFQDHTASFINVYLVDDLSGLIKNPGNHEGAVYIHQDKNNKFLVFMNESPEEYFIEETESLPEAINMAYHPYNQTNTEFQKTGDSH